MKNPSSTTLFCNGVVLVALFSIWLMLCGLSSSWAEKKGHKGIGYFLLSFFLSPIIGLIVVATISDKTMRECPFCKKAVRLDALVCGHCGKTLVSQKTGASKEKETWIAKRIVELIDSGKNASDAKIQAEAEYNVKSQEVSSDSLNTETEK